MSTNTRVLRCDTCNTPVSSAVAGDIMLRVSIIMCPDCLSRVPESVAEKFLAATAWPGAPYPKVTKPSWNYDPDV